MCDHRRRARVRDHRCRSRDRVRDHRVNCGTVWKHLVLLGYKDVKAVTKSCYSDMFIFLAVRDGSNWHNYYNKRSRRYSFNWAGTYIGPPVF